MHKLKCEYCGKVVDHAHKAAICECGHILKIFEEKEDFKKQDDDLIIEIEEEE